MDQKHFEGTIVLERLAEVHRLDEFFDAVDADDFARAVQIMRSADLDADTIAVVLQKMSDGDDS